MKRHKDSVKDPTTNGEAQVFVLPPDLLEKLGIQLSNFTHPPENVAENSIVCQSMKEDAKDLPGSVDGSSILETANLMKQSVFMSPTFVSTTTTETTSEQIITTVATETRKSFRDGNELFIRNHDAITSNTDRIELVNNNMNTTYNVTLESENFKKFPTISEYEVENYSGNLILTSNIELSNLNKAVDDHADEAYASDGSDGHTGTSTEITKNNVEEDAEQQKPSNKIKILSEQIINHSDLNTIKQLQTKNSSSCFVIPVNTIVTGKAAKNHSNNHLMQQTVQDELCNTSYHNKISDEIGKVDVINSMETVINKDTLVEDLLSDIHPGSIVTEDIKKLISNKVNKEGFDQNKVVMIVDIDKKTFPNNDDSKIKKNTELVNDEVRTMSDNTMEIVTNTENSLSKSKLCIQGVEKPGGKQENKVDTVLKTYQRTNIKKHIPELPHVDYTNTVDSNTLPEDVVIDLDDINIGGYKNANKFCICSDFGQLANYGSDTVYEHIHFNNNNNNNVGCNLRTLFSIYEDTSVLRELNVTENIDVLDDIIETNQHNICWLSFICEDNDDAVEQAILETKMDASNSTPGQPRRSNRNRKSTATEQVTENVAPKSEKTIKCGACGLVLSEVEWNKHKDSEHNLIAWKDGQTIVENTSNRNDIEMKKDLTPELIQRTRRSSRNLNLMIDSSESCIHNAEKPKVDHDKQTQKFTEDTEVSPKSNKISIGVVSIAKPKVKSSDIEEPSRFTRQSKKTDVISKSTGVEVTTKSTKNFIDISSEVTEIKANSKEKDKDIPKSMKRSTIEAVSIPSNIKEMSKAKGKDTTKLTRRSIDVSSEVTETKDTPKAEVKQTLKSEDTPIAKGKYTQRSMRRSIDVSSEVSKIKDTPTAEIKETSKSEDTSKATSKYSPKSTRKTIDVSSKVTEIKDTTNTEVKQTLKSEDDPKVMGKNTTKSTRRSIDVAAEVSKIKDKPTAEIKEFSRSEDNPKAMSKYTPKSTRKSIDVSSKVTEIKDTTNAEGKDYSTSTRRSINVSSKVIIIKDTSKAYIKDTPKFTKKSNKASSSPTEVKAQGTPISTKRLNNIDVTTKLNMVKEGDAPSKTTRKLIDVTGHPKSMQISKEASPSSKSNEAEPSSKAKTKSVDVFKKSVASGFSAKVSEQCNNIEVPQKLMSKSKDEEVISEKFVSHATRNLKEIDFFPLSPPRKTTNIESQLKSMKNNEDEAFSKSTNVKITPKTSSSSIDVSTKPTSKSKEGENSLRPYDNLKRKSANAEASAKITNKTINAEQKCKRVDVTPTSADVETCAKKHKNSIDAHVSLNIAKKYTRIKATKENTVGLNPMPTIGIKNTDTPPKYKTNSQDVSPTKFKRISAANETTKPQAVFVPTEKDFNAQSKSEIVGIEVNVPSKSLQESVNMEIVTTTQTVKTATADTDSTTKSNSQFVTVEASSNSDSGNSAAHSSPIQNSVANSEANNPEPVADIFAITIKQENLPECGVCKQAVDDSQWLEHIAREHDYLAWREDKPPLDLKDDEVIRAHLYAILKTNGGLKCSKCSVVRKYVKSYLTHINNCNGIKDEQSQLDVSTASADMDTTRELDGLSRAVGAFGNTRLKRNVACRSQMNVSSTSVDGMDATQVFVDVPQRSYSRVPVRNTLSQQRSVVCGVCSETVAENKWIEHIRIEHKYLAWKSGEPPLNVDDEVEVKIFLQNISKYNGGLICSKCGVVRLYVKKWMDHEATCKGDAENESSLDSSDVTDSSLNKTNVSTKLVEMDILLEIIKCGKCGKEMPKKGWIDHIETEHNYLAWIEGQPPLEENNTEAVSAYLHAMVKKRGALYCTKCGVSRKYPKAFLTHISACEISGFKREDFYVEVSGAVKPGEYECAVCHEKGAQKDFKKHAMDKHYNVAWMAGEIPINLKNPYAVEKYIKEYRTKHNLVCKVCGTTRVSCYGFYAHILTCGKAEDELEHLMNMCDICNNKYLCIYRNQHMAMHREQQIKKEMKERKAIKAEEEKNMEKANVEKGEPTGKRRAAEKAKKVMEKYTSNTQDGSHVCLSCHIGFDNATQLKDHVCVSQEEEANDSDVSVKLEGQEESEDDMEDVDSSISDEEMDSLTRKRHSEPMAKIVLPFKVRDFNYYLAKSFDNFCALHYTGKSLFNNWRSNDYDILSEEEASTYLPSLSESCKLRIGDEWETYKRFEARKRRDIILFTGATIRCMQWVPQNIDDEKEDFYLAVACFQHADCPRYGKEELPQHPGLLQIWRIGRFISTPKFELGLAHDYGTIWAMDWCPSGARDIVLSDEGGPFRLGLLAVACSNGCAYILSVPRFQTNLEVERIICKLKPMAELRLSANPQRPPFRPGYQATSISWSPQKDHDVVMVGYSDGTTALYNLNTTSPFLKAIENGVYIFYPFHDALSENSPITGVALTASEDLRRIVGGFASSSVTGATMSGWPGAAPVVRSHLAASSILYTPNWPAALLCSDDVLTMKSTNEMEWWGGGRRLGGACAAGGCARCGRVCLAAPPFVRVLRAHPCYPEIKKQIIATMKMVPIAQKRKHKLVNDDLGMIVEPLTYDETIKKYGLEFKTLSKKVRNVASKLSANAEQCPERFPLSDMPAAAFCPSNDHHNRLAIASHAGFVFIITA